MLGSLSALGQMAGGGPMRGRERERENMALCTDLERREGGGLGAKGSWDVRCPSLDPAGFTGLLCDLT